MIRHSAKSLASAKWLGTVAGIAGAVVELGERAALSVNVRVHGWSTLDPVPYVVAPGLTLTQVWGGGTGGGQFD